MHKRILPVAVTAIILFSLFSWNCTKLDTTDVGSDQLPAVDNVNTFDTVLNVISSQGIFNDSAYISKYDDYTVGAVNNDPLFGKTTANIYMQLKPRFYPYYFGNPGDTLVTLDSVILCLKYKGFWGDSTLPVHLDIREVNDFQFRDSVFVENRTNYKPAVGNLLGSADIDVRTLGNYMVYKNGRDSVNNQIRIPITLASWKAILFGRDSIASSSGNNAFYSDSTYRNFYNGIAVIANSPGSNGLIYASLRDTATKIEVHYKKRNRGVTDSVYSSFVLNPSFSPGAANGATSNTANYILRSRAGYPVSFPSVNEHYLQTSPGTYVNINVPGLPGFPNCVIHRAELIVEQIPTDPILDEKLTAPSFLYLDLKDSGVNNFYKPVYFDLNTTQAYDPDYKTTLYYFVTTVNYQYYGGYRRTKPDLFAGGYNRYYNINISRYVQHVVTDHYPAYNMRLYAPFNINYPQYSTTNFIPYGNNIAAGRVKIGSGSNPNYRLRLRIVYSKL